MRRRSPRLLPFRALRYSPRLAADLPRLLAPPYDLISPSQQRRYYRAHEHNVIRLILGKEYARDTQDDNCFSRAGQHLGHWLKQGVLIREKRPALYRYLVDYDPEGPPRRQDGLLVMLHLGTQQDPVLPHETTRPAPVDYVLGLTKATGAHLSPVMTLHQDPERRVQQAVASARWGRPVLDATVGRERHRLFACAHPDLAALLNESLGHAPVLIADGHHRYQAALAYRDLLGAGDGVGLHNYILTWLLPINENLNLSPTHRLVHAPKLKPERALARLKPLFEIEAAPEVGNWRQAGHALHQAGNPGGLPTFLALFGQPLRAARLVARLEAREALAGLGVYPEWRDLDVVMLEELVLRRALRVPKEAVVYDHSLAAVWRAVASAKADVAFLLNPPSIAQVQAIASAGLRMPPKSTYFHPKPLSGILLAPLT